MRENIGMYRGKRIDGKGWVYGSLVTEVYGGKQHAFITGTIASASAYLEVEPDTCGEYTGLQDKNGKAAYEGDRIKTHYANVPKADFVETIVFNCGSFCGEYDIDGGGKMWSPLANGVPHIHQDKSMYMEYFEIIGIIHNEIVTGTITNERS